LSKNKQTELWNGEFGNDYTERNTFTDTDIKNRQGMWRSVLNCVINSPSNLRKIYPESYCEIGAGNGQNIVAIHRMYADEQKPKFVAYETNKKAVANLTSAKYNDNMKLEINNTDWLNVHVGGAIADLVYTSGVLIHVHPDNLIKFMGRMFNASAKYVVFAEYFSPSQRAVHYRGNGEALWLNDFGSIFLDNFNVRCCGYNFMWKRVTGLDNLTTWIFEKVH